MNFKSLWNYLITDPNKTSSKQGPKQTRKLSTFVILFILINSIIGTSLFYLPSLGFAATGPASIIAWVLLFIIASVIMLYIGELITLHPTSGGTYEFAKRAYGRFGSFIAGWTIWIAGNFGMALNIVAAAEYFIPQQSQAAFLLRIGFAILWLVVLNYLAFRGVDAGATMLVTFGIITAAVLLLMTLPSFIDIPALLQGSFQSSFNPQHLTPFFTNTSVSYLPAIALALFLISEAFLGFEAVAYLANEAKNPRKLHKPLIAAIIICGVVMSWYLFSSLGTVSQAEYLSNARPFAVQALSTMGPIGEQIVVFGMYLVIIGAAAAWPITGSRLIQAMSKDSLFPRRFAKLHKKHNSPSAAVIFQTVMVFIFTWLIFRGYLVKWGNPYKTIYLIYILLSLIVISLVLLTVPILRRKEKHLPRPYKAPLGTIGPIALVALFVFLIVNWVLIEYNVAISTIKIALSFIVLGLPFYFLVESMYNQKSIVQTQEWLAYPILYLERIFAPFTIKNKIFKELGDLKNRTVLEYGCGVGSLTKRLALATKPNGKVLATDLSLTKVHLAQEQTKQHSHVSIFHHPHLHDFKLKTPKLDAIISIGMLSYMKKPLKILTKLHQTMKPKSEILFVDYDKFLHIFPNIEWIDSDAQLIKLFNKAGFNVTIERRRSLLWQHLIVSGKRK